MIKDIPPLVSIILATYNRPDVLKYAIESVLWQSMTDWELIVVGDGCVASTKNVIDHFNDSRIIYHNFEENFGEQSRANNWGVAHASGKYLAFLNHDDMYFSDHLDLMINTIQKQNADIVYSMQLAVNNKNEYRIQSYSPEGKFNPIIFVPASAWLLKREIIAKIGEWYSFKKIYGIPSQHWLNRAYRAKCNIFPIREISVIVIPSGDRQNSYLNKSIIHKEIYDKIQIEPKFRENMVYQSLLNGSLPKEKRGSIMKQFQNLIKDLILKLILIFGISPYEVIGIFRGGRKGQYINNLRKIRGLKSK